MTELQEYRTRLVNDTLAMAERAKIVKAKALAQLESQLADIDAKIQTVRQQIATLSAGC
jgi:hypothetical protein